MTKSSFIIKTSIANIYSKPDLKSELETEALFGEKIELIKKHKKWHYVCSITDGSKGWIQPTHYNLQISTTHKVNRLLTNIKSEANIKSHDLSYLLFNSKVNVLEIIENWAKIELDNKTQNNCGFVPLNHLVDVKKKYRSMSKFAIQFLNAPYKWGGKTFLGIDCSGLIQNLYNFTQCKFLPRNSKEQETFLKNMTVNIDDLKANDLVFWNGHVGLMKNRKEIIHATSYKMSVIVEKLDSVIKRIYKVYNLKPRFYRL